MAANARNSSFDRLRAHCQSLPASKQKAKTHSAPRRSMSVNYKDLARPVQPDAFLLSVTGFMSTPLLQRRREAGYDEGFLTFLKSTRLKICLLLSAAVCAMAFMNVSLGMSIICMTSGHPSDGDCNQKKNVDENPCYHFVSTPTNETDENGTEWFAHSQPCTLASTGFIKWSATIQGLVLSSLSWGRLFTPFAGLLSDRVNVKVLIGVGVGVASVFTALIPSAAWTSYIMVIALRFATGISDALVQPSVNSFIVKWFPRSERHIALSVITSGRQVAVLAAFPLAGYFCTRTDLIGGWPLIFYINSGFVVIWELVWLLFASQNPTKHRKITPAEAGYLSALRQSKQDKKQVPWKKLLSYIPMWANIGAILCHEIPIAVIFIFLPGYLNDVLHFTYKANGLLSATPAAGFMLSKLISGQLAYVCYKRFPTRPNLVPKAFNAVACVGMGSFLIGASFLDCSCRTVAVVFITLSAAFAGLHTPGCVSTLVTIAPPYTGTVGGIAFCIIGAAMMVVPIVVKSVVTLGTLAQWRAVLIGTGTIALLPVTFFSIAGSAETAPWAEVDEKPPSTRRGSSPFPINNVNKAIQNRRSSLPTVDKIVIPPPKIAQPRKSSLSTISERVQKAVVKFYIEKDELDKEKNLESDFVCRL